MAESTSTLQAKLKALTHGKVDIMLDEDTFKSTTQILREMSEAWEDMTDIERASALELMGGKRQANILSSVITNFETVEDVIETSMNSSGSAMEENARWMDSIEGKTYQFTNALETMWSNMLDSEVIKGFLDFGTGAIKILDTFPGKVTAVVAALAGFSKLKGISLLGLWQEGKSNIGNLANAFSQIKTITQTSQTNGMLPTETLLKYASAVNQLTASQQANLLASQGLSKSQIKQIMQYNNLSDAVINEATAHTIAKSATDGEIAAQSALFAAKAQNVAASLRATAANTSEAAAQQYNVAADIVEASTSKKVALAKLNEALASGVITPKIHSETVAKLGLAAANTTLAGTFKALLASMGPIGWIGLAISAIPLIAQGIDLVTKSAEELKEEVKELKETYTSTKEELDTNIKTLTKSSDTKLYATLEDEFTALARGVDKYGNNISLTSDQYERYKSICEQIVGINPLIASGYDSATEAIGNNASVLSQLIELQKEQARIAAEQYISDENLKVITTDVVNDYMKAWGEANSIKASAITSITNIFDEAFANYVKKTPGVENTIPEKWKWILTQIGYEAEKAAQIVDSYKKDNGNGLITYDTSFFTDYLSEIKENISKFGPEYESIISNAFVDAEEAFKNAEKKVQDAKDGLIETLLVVPTSSKDYSKLTIEGKNFLLDWIKNNDIFKIPDGTLTNEQTKAMKETILKMMNLLVSDVANIEYDGKKFTAQDLLSQIYNFDLSSVNYDEYQDKVRHMLAAFWTSLTDEQKAEYGFDNFRTFSISFGFDFVADDVAKSNMIKRYAQIKGITEEEARKYFESLPAVVVKRLLLVDWNLVDENNIDSTINGAKNYTASTKLYSSLETSITNYKEVLYQTAEIVSDNVAVTQDYKDSLTDIGFSTQELSDCFSEQNPLIVKNAALLRKLVNQKKQEQKATIQEARAYGQLQYKTTVGQIQKLVSSMEAEVKASGLVSSATLETIDTLNEQLDAIKQTIQQYSLLELQLSDAAMAYDEFESAKQRDSELTYGDSMIEMLETINNGFKTGQVGSEAFQAAVEALVPDSVYKDIDNVQERMQAIHDYIDKNPLFADWFTIEDGSFSITIKNIKSFIDDAFGAGLLTGDSSGDFSLTDEIKNAEDPLRAFADQMGKAFDTDVTESAVLAMLSSFEKYDARWGDIISDLTTTPLDREINNATKSLDKALQAQKDFITSGEPLYDENGNMTEGYKKVTDEVNKYQQELDAATKAAADNAATYTQVEAVLKGMSGEVKYTQEQANALAKSLGLVNENGDCTITIDKDGKLQLTQGQIDQLNKSLTGLTKPTILDIQLAYDNLDEQIKGLESRDPKILAELELTNASDTEIQEKINELKKNQDVIELVYNITTTSTEQANGNMEKLANWETNGINITITGDSSSLKEAVDEANNLEVEDKNPTIAMQGISIAVTEIGSVNDALSLLPNSKTIDIAVNYTTTGTPPSGGVGVDGNFHMSGGAFAEGSVGAPRTETALVGELGPELLVRNGRWTTIGDNGAEFTQVKKGDIIFNHKQTADLLSKGYVTGRGRLQGGAFASGTAYSGYGIFDSYVGDKDVFANGSDKFIGAANNLSGAAGTIADAADELKDVFDWIEVRIEELDETLALLEAQIENAVHYNEKNTIIDTLIDTNKTKLSNLEAGYQKYVEFAEELLKKVPEKYHDAVQNGAIAIESFADEADKETLEAIENYREWAQKAADFKQQAHEILATIRDLAIQKFDNAYEAGNVRATVEDSQTEKLQNAVDYDEERGLITSDAYYVAMMENSNKKIEYLTNAREAMQKELNAAVEAGHIERGSNEWYELLDQMYQIDAEIDEATSELEEFQNAINDIYWDNFDQLINRIDYLSNETKNLIELMNSEDMVVDPVKKKYENGTVEYWTADDVQWSEEGLATLGLYAQQMEIAEYKSKQYAEAIDDLTKEYEAGHYSENEYYEKLNELKDAQYESIEAYEDAKNAIVDLNKTRIDSIKKGIEKEIDAYTELIEKKKEALDAEKDMYDFQRSIEESNKEISDIERRIQALSYDNSASARAQRAKLEAELAKAQQDLQDKYYDRSVEEQKNALDKELENFQKEKDDEVAKMEEYLEDIKQVVADSLMVVQSNASGIYDTLTGKAEEYNLTLSESILTPWQDGSLAVSDYQETFDTAMSSTMDQLDALKNKWQEVIDKMTEASNINVDVINKENANYAAATPASTDSNQQEKSADSSQYSTYTVQSGDNLWRIAERELGAGSRWQEIYNLNKDIISNPDVIQPGWSLKIPKYAKGTIGTSKDQWAILDELGEELQLIPDGNGRLAYMKKGTGVVPADLTANLMEWGKLDPSTMLDKNKPEIGLNPSVVNNTEVNITMDIAEVVHIDKVDHDNMPDLTKAVEKQLDKYMKNLNAQIRRYTR